MQVRKLIDKLYECDAYSDSHMYKDEHGIIHLMARDEFGDIHSIMETNDGLNSNMLSRRFLRDSKSKCSLDNIYTIKFQENKRTGQISTVIIWKSGEKTIVKCTYGDEFDPEKGIAMCVMKYCFGNDNQFKKVFKEYLEESDDE